MTKGFATENVFGVFRCAHHPKSKVWSSASFQGYRYNVSSLYPYRLADYTLYVADAPALSSEPEETNESLQARLEGALAQCVYCLYGVDLPWRDQYWGGIFDVRSL